MAGKIGIIGAMDVEIQYLKGLLEDREDLEISGLPFSTGRIGDKDVVIALCGVGKVNAAICTQLVAGHFQVDKIINTGVGGSLDARIDIGDLVVSTDAIQHDMDVANLGYELGQVPGLPAGGFAADEALATDVVSAIEAAAPECKVFRGRIASGDQFVRDQEVKDRIITNFGALCCEMEGAAIAQACWINKTPFVIIRAISDKADGSQAEAYDEFEAKAAVHCAKLVEHYLRSAN